MARMIRVPPTAGLNPTHPLPLQPYRYWGGLTVCLVWYVCHPRQAWIPPIPYHSSRTGIEEVWLYASYDTCATQGRPESHPSPTTPAVQVLRRSHCMPRMIRVPPKAGLNPTHPLPLQPYRYWGGLTVCLVWYVCHPRQAWIPPIPYHSSRTGIEEVWLYASYDTCATQGRLESTHPLPLQPYMYWGGLTVCLVWYVCHPRQAWIPPIPYHSSRTGIEEVWLYASYDTCATQGRLESTHPLPLQPYRYWGGLTVCLVWYVCHPRQAWIPPSPTTPAVL